MSNKDVVHKVPSVNFHLWEPCNMRCKFCFASFQDVKKSILPKGHLPKKDAMIVIQKIAAFGFKKITFVGGEPLLCPWLTDLIREAKTLGLVTMLVTNGSRLDAKFLKENRDILDWICLSVDSLSDTTNILSGRAVTGKTCIGVNKYYKLAEEIKENGYRLKVNTVIHQYNYKEDFSKFISLTKPERWKVFQVLPIKGENDRYIDDFKITLDQYHYFLDRHKHIAQLVPESNDDITGSYVMIDPAGRFFDNSKGFHFYSSSVLNVSVENALKQIHIDVQKFLKRGGMYQW